MSPAAPLYGPEVPSQRTLSSVSYFFLIYATKQLQLVENIALRTAILHSDSLLKDNSIESPTLGPRHTGIDTLIYDYKMTKIITHPYQ